jgi:small nuclear ribonucleoprotein (snRNP)-like protein
MDFFGFTFIMFIGAASALLGFLILLFTAFTTSAAWGIGSLLVPPAIIAFAVSHWSKAKNGFVILMIGVIIFAYGNWDKNRAAIKQAATQTEQDTISATQDVMPEQSQPAQPETPAANTPAPSATPVPPPATVNPPAAEQSDGSSAKPVVINIIDAHKYINHEVRVTTDSGKVRIGTLLEVDDSGIIIDYVVEGATGRVRSHINEDQIHLIELLQ